MFALGEKLAFGRDHHHAAVIGKPHALDARLGYVKSAAGFDGVIGEVGKLNHAGQLYRKEKTRQSAG